jgi:hypothetical protein
MGQRRSVLILSHDPFVTHRSLIFTVAYVILDSAADAEDAVQEETWLPWSAVDRTEVQDPRRTWCGSSPGGARPAAHADAPTQGLHRAVVAARAAAHHT